MFMSRMRREIGDWFLDTLDANDGESEESNDSSSESQCVPASHSELSGDCRCTGLPCENLQKSANPHRLSCGGEGIKGACEMPLVTSALRA